MEKVLKALQYRLQTGYQSLQWQLTEKKRYLQEEPLLRAPRLVEGDGSLRRKQEEYYRDGFTFLYEDRYASVAPSVLEQLRNDFADAITIYGSPEAAGKLIRTDGEHRQWSGGRDSGVIRLSYEDPSHPAFEEVFGKSHAAAQREKKVATVEALYAKYPFVKQVVEDPLMQALAAYANGGDTRPMMIQLERKTRSRKEQYNFIHFDTVRSTFKAYLYLTDVEEAAGPLALSKGSHHWKLYPLLLYEVMAKRKNRFVDEDMGRYGLEPFTRVHGKAGSLFCFSGNTIHTATNVQPERERWSIQFYYYSLRRHSSDKRRSELIQGA